MDDKKLIPLLKETKCDIADMIENARTIKGDDFVSMVMFLSNIDSLIGVIIHGLKAAEAPPEVYKLVQDLSTKILNSITSSYAMALNISLGDAEEAKNLSDTIASRVHKISDALND